MALRITKTYATVFEVNVNDKYVRANLSTSRKLQDGSFANSYWNATFLGKSLDVAKTLKDKDRIIVNGGMISYEKAMKDGEAILGENGKPKYYTNVTIFEVEKVGSGDSATTAQSDEGDGELPF